MSMVVRSYIDFLVLFIPTPLVSVLFCSSTPTICSFFYVGRSFIELINSIINTWGIQVLHRHNTLPMLEYLTLYVYFQAF